MPDIDLILWGKVKSGDTGAFELLFRKYYPILCLFSRRFTGDLDNAREIVQELFVYLWEHKNDLEINIALKGYLLRAVRYNSIRRVEKDRKAAVRIESLPEISEDPSFYDHLEYAELQEKILEAVETLPFQCKRVFILSRYQQLKYTEIAKKLDISVKTVEAHISKALKLIQDYLRNNLIFLLALFSLWI